MAEYIDRETLLKRLDMAIDCKNCPRCVDMKTYYDRCAYTDIEHVCGVISEMPAIDVQPVDKDDTNIIYIGKKAYLAKNTIIEFMKKMDIIRDSLAHIENYFDNNKELLHHINCCTRGSDNTSEIEYFINRIKENCGYD